MAASNTKTEFDAKSPPTMVDDVMPDGNEQFKSANIDIRDMWRMGRIQELRVRCLHEPSWLTSKVLQRRLGPWAILGFASILGCVWQYVVMYCGKPTASSSYTNGSQHDDLVTPERWTGRRSVHVLGMLRWIDDEHALASRNVEHGTFRRW